MAASLHFMEPTKSTRSGLSFLLAPTRSTSTSPLLFQYPPTYLASPRRSLGRSSLSASLTSGPMARPRYPAQLPLPLSCGDSAGAIPLSDTYTIPYMT